MCAAGTEAASGVLELAANCTWTLATWACRGSSTGLRRLCSCVTQIHEVSEVGQTWYNLVQLLIMESLRHSSECGCSEVPSLHSSVQSVAQYPDIAFWVVNILRRVSKLSLDTESQAAEY